MYRCLHRKRSLKNKYAQINTLPGVAKVKTSGHKHLWEDVPGEARVLDILSLSIRNLWTNVRPRSLMVEHPLISPP